MTKPEHIFQPAAYSFLQKNLPPPFALWSVEYPVTVMSSRARGDNEHGRMLEASRLKKRGIIPGPHDIHFLRLGVFGTVECKYGTNMPTVPQKTWGAEVVAAGGKICCAWSCLDIYHCYKDDFGWGAKVANTAEWFDAHWMARVGFNCERGPSARTKENAWALTAGQAAMRVRLNDPVPDLTGDVR